MSKRRGSKDLSKEEERSKRIAVGIVIGERWTYAAAYENGIATDVLKKMPSVITFTEEKTYFGSDGLRQSFANIENTVYAFFGLLGRDWEEKEAQDLARNVTYTITKLKNHYHSSETGLMRENIGIPILLRGYSKATIYTPIQIVSEFLKYAINKVERELRCPVHNVAIALPSTFGQKQRRALLQAANFIPSVRLVSSTICAAVYSRYHLANQAMLPMSSRDPSRPLPPRTSIFVDISHMACSVAVVDARTASSATDPRKSTDMVEVKGTLSSTSAGLGQCPNRMATLVVSEFVEQYHNYHDDMSGLLTSGPKAVEADKDDEKEKGKDKKALPPATIRTTVDEAVAQGTAPRKKHAKKLSMADRLLASKAMLATMDLDVDPDDDPFAIDDDDDEKKDDKPVKKPAEKTEDGTEVLLAAEMAKVGTKGDGGSKALVSGAKKDGKRERTEEELKEEEALKCRFRSRMICANVLEHLHDRYSRNISLHYDGFYAGYSLHLSMRLSTLNGEIVQPFVGAVEQMIDSVLEQCADTVSVDSVVNVILSGDGANVPSITQMVQDYFEIDEHLLSKPVVPRGASIVCALDHAIATTPMAIDVMYATLSLADPAEEDLKKAKLHTLIDQGTACPCKKTILVTTKEDGQTELNLCFFEGEGTRSYHNKFVGEYIITDIEPRPAGETKISLQANIDRNCVFLLTAEDVTDESDIKKLDVAQTR